MKEQTLDEKLEHILLKLMINSETEYPDSKAISEIKAAVLESLPDEKPEIVGESLYNVGYNKALYHVKNNIQSGS